MDPLFKTGKIGILTLKNRIIRSATWEGMAGEDGSVTPPMIDLYRALAEGGAGLLITGHSYVRLDGRHSPRQLGSHSDEMIPGLASLAKSVHDHGGRIALQLNYGGAYLSKSRVARMSPMDLEEVVQAFGLAARRARQAGFDAVQVLAAHGFFLSQLLCPRYNPRTDDYGGSIDNRARVLIRVVQAIREEAGSGYPLLVKLNSSDLMEDGLRLEEAVLVAQWLEKGGVDAIEISGGLLNRPDLLKARSDRNGSEVFFEAAAREFRKKISTPLILVGGIRSYETGRRLIEANTADYIALCRPFIREPGLVNRWASGDTGDAYCIACNNCVEELKKGFGLHCLPVEAPDEKTFFPQKSEKIPGSPTFPPEISYQVSYGLEEWQGQFLPVVKIQMVNGEKSLGPGLSFPGHIEEFEHFFQLIRDLIKN